MLTFFGSEKVAIIFETFTSESKFTEPLSFAKKGEELVISSTHE